MTLIKKCDGHGAPNELLDVQISMMIKRKVNDDDEGNHEYFNATE